MKSITIDSFLSTGLNPSLDRVRSIEIDDTPLGQGGFGIAFRMRGINNGPDPPQVVKILLDNGHGIGRHGLGTIQELQRRLQIKNSELQAHGRTLISEFPALLGVPQLSFEGRLDGRAVCGYTANDLTASGMEDFA